MTKRTYGMLAGIAGAAFAWWMRKRHSTHGMTQAVEERGEVIYSNSPLI